MKQPLSPAAQAVLDAAYTLPLKNGQPSIAAAVRAAADRSMNLIGDVCHPKYIEGIEAASDFLEHIAVELEGANPDCGEEVSLHERFTEARHD